MTPKQIDLVQATFKDVAAIKDDAAALFYNRLFELDPKLKRLFKSDMKEQGRKLMATIGLAVNSLRKLDTILPAVQKLAQRHVDYGVTEADYQTVGTALIWTLRKGLGAKFTPEVEEAWTTVYTALAGVMIEAAREKPMQDEILLLFSRAFDKRMEQSA